MPLILPHGFFGQSGLPPIVPAYRGSGTDATSATNKVCVVSAGPAVETLTAYVACVVWSGSGTILACKLAQFGEAVSSAPSMTAITSKITDASNQRNAQFFKLDRAMPGGVGNSLAVGPSFSVSTALAVAGVWDLGAIGIGRNPVSSDQSSASSSAGARSATVAVGDGRCLLAGYTAREDSGGAVAVAWTNATERADAQLDTSMRYSFADASALAKGARIVTCTPADTEDQNVLQVVAW